ncbi:MAG: SH3 domain-containing protein [Pseudomonadota bacterium]|nr:SH3 domain-containing protein [Pseudomonadota bacterium]|tara:strand:+ start:153 stop:854 length:702 start_codon:yes stop_codon:yes gene_type:complete
MQFWGRSHHAILITLSLGVLSLSASAQTYIGLRSGPSSTFPVVYEVTEKRELDVIYRRGSWVKVTDGRSRGWLHVDDLHLLATFPRDEMWKLANDARPGRIKLGLAGYLEGAYSVGLHMPLADHYLQLRAARGPESDSAWSQLDVSLIMPLAQPTESLSVSWLITAGAGLEQQDNNRWRDLDDNPVWLLGGGVETSWHAERYFEVGARVEASVTADDDMTLQPLASVFWRIRL